MKDTSNRKTFLATAAAVPAVAFAGSAAAAAPTFVKMEAKMVTLQGDASVLNADLSNGWQVAGFSIQGSGSQNVLLTRPVRYPGE